MRILKTLGGIVLACLAFSMALATFFRLTHPGLPHPTRVFTELALTILFGSGALSLFQSAFAKEGGDLQRVGQGEFRTAGDRLTFQSIRAQLWKNVLLYSIWGVGICWSLPHNVARHAWVLAGFQVLILLFDILMVTVSVTNWKAQFVWDRARGVFEQPGKPPMPLARIQGIGTEKNGGVYALALDTDAGRQKIVSTALMFGKPQEAERAAGIVRDFLQLAPVAAADPAVWPPPPTAPVSGGGTARG